MREDIEMEILKYINENYLIVISVIYVLGMVLKAISIIPDEIIPLILLVVGIGFGIAIGGFTVQAVMQGILVAGAAVFTNQFFKQTPEGFLKLFKQPDPPKEINPEGKVTEFRK
jgi:hypothetical protein